MKITVKENVDDIVERVTSDFKKHSEEQDAKLRTLEFTQSEMARKMETTGEQQDGKLRFLQAGQAAIASNVNQQGEDLRSLTERLAKLESREAEKEERERKRREVREKKKLLDRATGDVDVEMSDSATIAPRRQELPASAAVPVSTAAPSSLTARSPPAAPGYAPHTCQQDRAPSHGSPIADAAALNRPTSTDSMQAAAGVLGSACVTISSGSSTSPVALTTVGHNHLSPIAEGDDSRMDNGRQVADGNASPDLVPQPRLFADTSLAPPLAPMPQAVDAPTSAREGLSFMHDEVRANGTVHTPELAPASATDVTPDAAAQSIQRRLAEAEEPMGPEYDGPPYPTPSLFRNRSRTPATEEQREEGEIEEDALLMAHVTMPAMTGTKRKATSSKDASGEQTVNKRARTSKEEPAKAGHGRGGTGKGVKGRQASEPPAGGNGGHHLRPR